MCWRNKKRNRQSKGKTRRGRNFLSREEAFRVNARRGTPTTVYVWEKNHCDWWSANMANKHVLRKSERRVRWDFLRNTRKVYHEIESERYQKVFGTNDPSHERKPPTIFDMSDYQKRTSVATKIEMADLRLTRILSQRQVGTETEVNILAKVWSICYM